MATKEIQVNIWFNSLNLIRVGPVKCRRQTGADAISVHTVALGDPKRGWVTVNDFEILFFAAAIVPLRRPGTCAPKV